MDAERKFVTVAVLEDYVKKEDFDNLAERVTKLEGGSI